MTDIECPAEGCDYAEETATSVKGHINGMSDPEHGDKEALREAVDEQTEEETTETEGQQADDDHPDDPAQGDDDGGGGGGSSDDDPEQAEQPDEQATEGQTDHSDDPDMPTDDELARQRDRVTTTDDQGDSGGDSTPSKTPKQAQPAPSSGGIPLPVSTTTLFAGVALVVMLVVLWSYLGTEDDTEQVEESNDTNDEEGGEFDALSPANMEAAE